VLYGDASNLGRRYRSVEALIRDVDHYLKREPLEARPDTVGYRFDKFVRRNRREVVSAAVAAVLVVGLVVFFTVRLAKARDSAVAEAARTQRIQRFTMNLFQGGDESVGPADDLRVITLVDRGVQEAQALTADPRSQAEIYQTLGTVYENLGKLDKAEQLLNTSLKQRETLFGGDSPEVAESLIAIAGLRDVQARYDEAEKLVRKAWYISKRPLGAQPSCDWKSYRFAPEFLVQELQPEIRCPGRCAAPTEHELARATSERGRSAAAVAAGICGQQLLAVLNLHAAIDNDVALGELPSV